MLESLSAERNILSILLNKPDLLYTIEDVLSGADFTNTGNSMIFGIFSDLVKSGTDKVDAYLLASEAEKRGLELFNEHTLSGDLIKALLKQKPNADDLGKYVADVKQCAIKRSLLQSLDEAKDDVANHTGPSIELRNKVEEKILGSIKGLDTGESDIICLADDFEDTINKYADNPGGQGLDIRLPRWQKDCGGMRNGTITGLFARAKAGKSQFSMWSAFQTAIIDRKPILYLDTELQPREQQMRLCGMISGIPYEDIESGKWRANKEQLLKIKAAFEIIKQAPIYYKNIAGYSVQHIVPIIRKFIHKKVGYSNSEEPRCLVIYDYIKLMSGNDLGKAQEWQLLGFLVSELHDLTVKLNFPMLALGQLNRDALKLDSELAAAGADRIVHLVDSFTILRPKKAEEVENDGKQRGNYVLKVCVSRYGPGHENNLEWINLHFDKGCGQFKEDKRNSEVLEVVSNMEGIREHLQDEDILGFGEVKENAKK